MRASTALRADAQPYAPEGEDALHKPAEPHPHVWFAEEPLPPPQPRVSVAMAFGAGFLSSIALAGLAWVAISFWPVQAEPVASKQTIAIRIAPLVPSESNKVAEEAKVPARVAASRAGYDVAPRQAEKAPDAPLPAAVANLPPPVVVIAERPAPAPEPVSQEVVRAPDPPSAAPSAFEEEVASAAARIRSAAVDVPLAVEQARAPVAHKRRVIKEAKAPVAALPLTPAVQDPNAPAAPAKKAAAASILGAETPFSYVWQQQPLQMPSVGRN